VGGCHCLDLLVLIYYLVLMKLQEFRFGLTYCLIDSHGMEPVRQFRFLFMLVLEKNPVF